MNTRLVSAGFVLLVILAFMGTAAVGWAAGRLMPGNGAPTLVSYQGVINEGGSPYTGTGYFKFAVVNAAGSITYWSNDGTSSGGGEPTEGVAISVSQGLFNLLLGDTTLPHMVSLSASAFSGTERYFRIWFSSDGSTYTLLSPDQRVASVPYALQAQEALTAEDANTLDGFDSTDFASPLDIGLVLSVGESRELAAVSGLTLDFTCTDPSGVGDQVLGQVLLVSCADGTEGVVCDIMTLNALQGWKEEWANAIDNGSSGVVLTWRAELGQTPGWQSARTHSFWFASIIGGSIDGVLTAHVGDPFWDQCALSGHLVEADAASP